MVAPKNSGSQDAYTFLWRKNYLLLIFFFFKVLSIEDSSNMRIVLEAYRNETEWLNVPSNTLESEGFRKSNKVNTIFFFVFYPFLFLNLKQVLCVNIQFHNLMCYIQLDFDIMPLLVILLTRI